MSFILQLLYYGYRRNYTMRAAADIRTETFGCKRAYSRGDIYPFCCMCCVKYVSC